MCNRGLVPRPTLAHDRITAPPDALWIPRHTAGGRVPDE